MVFYVGDAKAFFEGTADHTIQTVFATSGDHKINRWVPIMSERVCLVNNEQMKVLSKASSISSLGTQLLQVSEFLYLNFSYFLRMSMNFFL